MQTTANDKGMKFLVPGWFENIDGKIFLMGTRCLGCGKVSFPKKPVCPDCFEDRLEVVPLSRKGTLHTFACSHMGPRDMDKPFVMGFIDLPEGIKLYAVITECDPWQDVLEIGMPMEMVIGRVKTDDSGNEIFSYQFRPGSKEDAR